MNAQSPFHIRLGSFRSALVIEEEDALRSSIVQFLKVQGWLVHGMKRAEQALPILAHVLYELVVIDVELPGITGIAFVRILRNSREWRTDLVSLRCAREQNSVDDWFAPCAADANEAIGTLRVVSNEHGPPNGQLKKPVSCNGKSEESGITGFINRVTISQKCSVA